MQSDRETTIEPVPVLQVTETTVLRHLKAEPESPVTGAQYPRVSVSRGFNYQGPIYFKTQDVACLVW